MFSIDPPPTRVLDYAASLAKRCGAAVTGLHVCEPMSTLVATTMPAAAGIIAAWSHERLARARAAAADFERWATHAGLARSSWQIAQGPVPDTLAYAGNWHDLLVVERDDGAVWGTINAVGQLLLGCGIPLLVLPSGYARPASLDCVAVAWNGSPESTRALHAALPLLRLAHRIVLLQGQRRTPFSPILEAPAFHAGEYLERHGLHFDHCLLERPDERSGVDILEAASSMRADLLVMGGYGRNRFSEWVLGGATRHVLREAAIPVMLRH